MNSYRTEDYQAYINFINHKKPKEVEDEKYYKGDMHIHSKYSYDSNLTLETIISAAEKEKISYVGIADHIDFGNEATAYVADKIKRRNEEIDKLQETTNVKLLKGVEVGEPHLYLSELEYLKKLVDLDYIIGSIHYIKGISLGRQKKIDDLVNRYYQEVLLMVENAPIDIVGHIDYIKRYVARYKLDTDLIYQILDSIRLSQIALEVNTSGIRRCGSAFPELKILEYYAKTKGNKITYGSDAHEESELFDKIKEISKEQKIYKLSQGVIINHKFKQI